MTKYYEAHITMTGDPEILKPLVEATKWKFSCIDGDANLGDGIKCYATKQMNLRIGEEGALSSLFQTARILIEQDVKVIRQKIELVIFDSKIDKVACAGNCPECVG